MLRTWLIDIRKSKGWTQQQVSDQIGLSRSYLAQIELGQRGITLDVAKRMCKILDIPWQTFFDQD